MIKGNRERVVLDLRPNIQWGRSSDCSAEGGTLVQVLTRFLFTFVFVKVFFLFRSFLSPSSFLHPLALTPRCVDPNTPPCVHSKRPCVQAKRPHALEHVDVLPVHTETFGMDTRRRVGICTLFSTFFSACRTTHTLHTKHTHTHQTHTPQTTDNTTPQTTPQTPHALPHTTQLNITRRQRQ